MIRFVRYIMRVSISLIGIIAMGLSCGDKSSSIDDCLIFAIVISGEGTVNYEPELACYQTGTQVFLSAIPGDDWIFYKWTGNVTFQDSMEYDSNIMITFENDNIALVANFREELSLTVTIDPLFGGTVEADPDRYYYVYRDSVTLEAVPNTGYTFSHWLYDDLQNNTNPIEIIFDLGDEEITAVFNVIE